MIVLSIRNTSLERCTVQLDSGEEVLSTLGAVTELRLFDGKSIDREQLDELKLLSVRYLAREKSLELLSHRQMSSGELHKKLMDKGYDRDTADYCTQWSISNGFINDSRYAEAVARHYFQKGYGSAKIRAEFSKRLISREFWEEAMNTLPESNSEIDRILASKLKGCFDSQQVSKACASLYRRGFSWEQIKESLHRLEEDL